jgi:hypothetical protein
LLLPQLLVKTTTTMTTKRLEGGVVPSLGNRADHLDLARVWKARKASSLVNLRGTTMNGPSERGVETPTTEGVSSRDLSLKVVQTRKRTSQI